MGEKTDIRDCENCMNYVAWDDRPEIKSCRKWECEYEPREEVGNELNDRAEMVGRSTAKMDGKEPQ